MSSRNNHAQWSSSLGFILAAVGSAVGLGNIWKFPYMVGESGGSAFVVAYLICIALIGFPILVAEWLIGRRGQKNPIHSYQDVANSEGKSSLWGLVGGAGILSAFFVLSFYSVIGGWTINYTLKVTSGIFAGQSSDTVEGVFNAMLASPTELTLWHSVFMLLTIAVVAVGVNKGIEKTAKVLMPLLGIILLGIVLYNVSQGGFGRALTYMFSPDFSKIDGSVLIAALGHAFFTLSIGAGIMVAYGSYLGKKVNLFKVARTVVVLDTVIAIVAGLAIFPIIFSNGQDPAAGPGLIFVSLPIAFGNMPAGLLVGTLFFLLVSFAALTSAVSLLEPSVELLEERTPLNRFSATLIAGFTIWLLGIATLLSFNLWSDVTILGNNIFDALDKLTSKFMLPLTGLAAITFVGWVLKQDILKSELGLSNGAWVLWQFTARFIAPIGVIIVFVGSLL